MFAVFLAGAFGALALAQLRAGVNVEASVGLVGKILASPLVTFVGWPSAVLIPLVPAVHALRLFGRLESDTDRSWMIFFAGLVALLPVALALALPAPRRVCASGGAGIWGELIAAWWTGWFGAFGAWVVVVLSASVLMAATLAWNPVRALVGHRAPVDSRRRGRADRRRGRAAPKRRKKRDASGDDAPVAGNLALALEPPPEEMPAIDPSLDCDAAGDVEPDARRWATPTRTRQEAKEEVEGRGAGRSRRGDRGGDRSDRARRRQRR